MQALPENTEQVHQFGEYTIERINDNNLHDVGLLHHAIYGSHLPKGYYHKKYGTAYTGATYTGFIAYNNRLPIAFYGVVPCFLQCGETRVLAAQSTDTMTHPEYRKKGLLTEVHRYVLNLSREEGIKILFGFGNQDSIPIYKHKYNWEENGIMDRFEIPVRANQIIGFLRTKPVLKNIFTFYQKAVLKRYVLPQAGINSQDIQHGYCGVYRDQQYLEHKKYNDTIVISIGKSKVWVKTSNDLMIGDIELIDNTLDEVIAGIKKMAKQLGIQKIHFIASRPSILHDLFVKKYEAIPAFPVLYKDLGSGLELGKIKFTFADIDIF